MRRRLALLPMVKTAQRRYESPHHYHKPKPQQSQGLKKLPWWKVYILSP
jgi:hypothetical protein